MCNARRRESRGSGFYCAIILVTIIAAVISAAYATPDPDPGRGHRPWWESVGGANVTTGNFFYSPPTGGGGDTPPFGLCFNSVEAEAPTQGLPEDCLPPGWSLSYDAFLDLEDYSCEEGLYRTVVLWDCDGTQRWYKTG